MSVLRQALSDYLAMRRALGYRLERPEKLLGQFIDYLEDIDAATITIEHSIAWATLPSGSRAWSALRLSAVRGFAGYLHTLDASCEVPPSDVLVPRPRPRVPYLYSEQQLAGLLAATTTIRTRWRALTYRTLLGTLAVTGMRVGEAIKADRDDVDLDDGVLLVRHGKFGKSRLLPLHPTTSQTLADYLNHPQRPQRADCRALFVSTTGSRLLYPNINRTFKRLLRVAGVTGRSPRCHPRIHDIRHSFAVHTLLDCYQTGVDVDARLPALSTYLGHVNPAHTYWYLTAAPELLALAGQRLQTSLGELG